MSSFGLISILLEIFCIFTTVQAALSLPGVIWPSNAHLDSIAFPQDLPTGECNAQTPCPIAACCGGKNNNLCGFSPGECGVGNCTSKCDSKAECGQYGEVGKQKCPLSVCCSQFGFCGSTDDFCGKGCQAGFGGCGPPNRPSCGGTSVAKRTIGYYESWSNTRKCQSVGPEDLNLNGFTHINFAFAFFDPKSFAIAPMDGKTGALYNRFTGLKNSNRGLQTWISVGGWSFTDPGPTRTAFSTMASSSGNRAMFINGLKQFMATYGFDGVDLDWEYPQADDRGGTADDKTNYVSLIKEMRAAFGTQYGITVTLPTSYWYLQHFDLPGIQDSIDWFNLMSYDLHGVWDADSKFVGPYVAPHTNITEIDGGLDLLWRAGVLPGKVVLGQGWYGRSFTLKDPSCKTPNGVCQFSGGANAGPCSNAAGILDLQEIKDVISTNNLTPTWDKVAGVKWITWGGNQWVSYDDDDTFKQKRDFANSRCLGGLMVWAMDQVDQKADNNLSPADGVTTDQQKDAKQKSDDLQAGISCYTTECDIGCKKGTNQVAQMSGQPGQMTTNGRCDKNKYRNLCCDDGTLMGICQWRGFRGVGLSCMGGCADGETEVVQDTNHKEKKSDQTCTGGIQSYCCKGFKPALNGADLVKDAEELAKSAAIAAAEMAALDIAAKAFCRIAVPALLAPLELLEDAIPIIGEILDIAEIAATPAIIQGCVKAIEKEGKAEFKIFGKKHTLSMNKPSDKPTATRPRESSHSSASTQTACSLRPKSDIAAVAARGELGRNDGCDDEHREITTEIKDNDGTGPEYNGEFLCDYRTEAQACLHYKSMHRVHPLSHYNKITCQFKFVDSPKRPVVAEYNKDRPGNSGWYAKIPYGKDNCERDEWPPAKFHEVNDGRDFLKVDPRPVNPVTRAQFVRYLPLSENQSAGDKVKAQNCPKMAKSSDHVGTVSIEKGRRGNTQWSKLRADYTRKVVTLNWGPMDNPDDDGLGINPCQPQQNGVDHRGFALLNRDDWFLGNAAGAALRDSYKKAPPFRRDVVNPDLIAVIGENSTRLATDEELKETFGIIKCADEKACSKELEQLGYQSAEVLRSSPHTVPVEVAAETSTTISVQTSASTGSNASSAARITSASQPQRTAG